MSHQDRGGTGETGRPVRVEALARCSRIAASAASAGPGRPLHPMKWLIIIETWYQSFIANERWYEVVSHGRHVTFQLAEVAAPRELLRKILNLIDDLRSRRAPA